MLCNVQGVYCNELKSGEKLCANFYGLPIAFADSSKALNGFLFRYQE